MIRMKSPTPNRKGKYEIHDVPSRRIAALKAQGWIEINEQQNKISDEKTERNKSIKRSYKRIGGRGER
jgi:hypothetical protein